MDRSTLRSAAAYMLVICLATWGCGGSEERPTHGEQIEAEHNDHSDHDHALDEHADDSDHAEQAPVDDHLDHDHGAMADPPVMDEGVDLEAGDVTVEAAPPAQQPVADSTGTVKLAKDWIEVMDEMTAKVNKTYADFGSTRTADLSEERARLAEIRRELEAVDKLELATVMTEYGPKIEASAARLQAAMKSAMANPAPAQPMPGATK